MYLLFQGFIVPMIIIFSVKSLRKYSEKKVKEFVEAIKLTNQWRRSRKVNPNI